MTFHLPSAAWIALLAVCIIAAQYHRGLFCAGAQQDFRSAAKDARGRGGLAMPASDPQHGGCLCGRVRFSIAKPSHHAIACHCSMCRRWSGGVLFSIDAEHAVSFDGEEHLVWYRSSDWAERGFCRTCGSGLVYRLTQSGQLIVSAGALDDQSTLELGTEFFVDEKPAYYAFANDTEKLTGQEVFARFMPPETKT
jgi:hypothetical protein